MKMGKVNFSRDQIVDFCKRNHIRKLALFGSVLRDDFRPDSDIDILIDIEQGAVITFLDIARMEIELSEMLNGRNVDLRTPSEFGKYLNKVITEAEVQYERA
jgi:predicted nucleotidyltransferase